MYAGRCTKYFTKLGVGEFLVENEPVRRGAKILVTGPTTGALIQVADSIHGDNGELEVGERGMLIAIKTNERVRPNDKLYLLVSRSLSDN